MSSDDRALFSNFGKSFQEKIVQALLIDRQWASQFCEVVKPEYFEYAYLQKLVDKYLTYQKKYRDFPSLQLMVDIMKDEMKTGIDAVLKDQIIDCIKRIASNKELGDLAYVKEKSLDFCKRMELKAALTKSVGLIEENNFESIVEIIKRAMMVGSDNAAGMDLANDVEARYTQNARKTIPTGIPELDEKRILNGGLGVGEIGTIVAPTGCGKSQLLVHIGAQALLRGKNVLHFTFELSEIVTGIRYDSHLIDISSTDCPDHKNEIDEFYKKSKDTLGTLKIKFYPTSTITANQLRAYIEKAKLEGFTPDLVIVDYAGIMRSSERYELPRFEMKKVFEELRALGHEMNVPIWTASQSNKEGISSEVVDSANMAESYSQAHVADVIIGLSRRLQDKATGICKIYVAKNRAGMDGVSFTGQLDTSRSKIRVLTETDVNATNDVSDDAMKSTVRSSVWSAYKTSQNNNPSNQNVKNIPLEKIQ